MQELEIKRTVGQLVTDNYKAAEVFKKHKIDFCCGGKKSLDLVCAEQGLDYDTIVNELNDINQEGELPSQNFKRWDAAFLSDYIVQTHHRYVTDAIPLLLELTEKVARVHGAKHPELVSINYHFKALASELTSHLKKEEMVLFPYIKQMANAQNGISAPFGTVQNPINMMEHEHDDAGELIYRIRELSDDFTPPEGACNTYKVTFAKLKEFEQDLYQHIHLENNILFPKAIELEQSLAVSYPQ